MTKITICKNKHLFTSLRICANMPITPVDWGGFKWMSIHVTCYYIDILYGKDLGRQQKLHDWINLSAYMLPCGICEHHFLDFTRDNSLPEVQEYEPGETPYLRWSIRAHNAVRKRQRKTLADEDLVVLTYKSGKIYGADTYLADPKTRTSLAADTDPSGNTAKTNPENGYQNGYQIATYILGGVLGLIVLAATIYLIVRSLHRRPLPEMSE